MKLLRWFSCLLVAACMTVPSPAERRGVAEGLARAQGWVAVSLPAGQFDLQAFVPERLTKRAPLTIYIEGDGLEWITGAHDSRAGRRPGQAAGSQVLTEAAAASTCGISSGSRIVRIAAYNSIAAGQVRRK